MMMPEPEATIETMSCKVDRHAYFRTMYTYDLWKRLFAMIGFMVLLALLLGLIDRSLAYGALIGIAFVIPLVLALRYFAARRNVFGKTSAIVFDDPRMMRFSSWGVYLKSESDVESKVPWSHFHKAVRRGGFTLLFFGRIQHFIVADYAFKNPEDFRAFLNLLSQQTFPVTPKRNPQPRGSGPNTNSEISERLSGPSRSSDGSPATIQQHLS